MSTRRAGALAVACGLLLAAAVPPWGWWPLAFVGVAGLSRLLREPGRRRRVAIGFGLAFGWFAPSVLWMLDFSAPGYVITLLTWGAMLSLALVAVPTGPWRWLALPGALALFELVRWSWPFGGVPLSTIPMSQAAAPLAPVVRVAGPALLVIAVTVVAVAVDAARERAWRVAGVAAAILLAVVGLAAVAPRGEATGTLDVALVQGGGPQRTRAVDTDERVVFDRHLDASAAVVEAQADDPVDLVVWPENVVNIEGRVVDHPWGEELSELARDLGVPLVVGVVEGEGDVFYNAAVLIDPDGDFTARFDKVRRVPFGEYVPLRPLLEPFAGEALPARDAVPGDEDAVLQSDVGPLGVVISWEVFFAPRARDAIGNGGEVLLNPTNGSSYWLTQVQTQQVASSRLRALETGRWTLQAAPTGFTAIVTPDGEVVDRTAISEQAVVRGTVERRTGLTWATRVGDWPALLLGVVVVGGAWVGHRRWPGRSGLDPGHLDVGHHGGGSGG